LRAKQCGPERRGSAAVRSIAPAAAEAHWASAIDEYAGLRASAMSIALALGTFLAGRCGEKTAERQ